MFFFILIYEFNLEGFFYSFMESYKYYSRFVSVISALIIIIASLDASQVIHLFPEYAAQINTILMIAGLLAPVIAQEKRVVRAEKLVVEDMSQSDAVNDDVAVDDVDYSDDEGC